jgi:hypothetical protein
MIEHHVSALFPGEGKKGQTVFEGKELTPTGLTGQLRERR